MKDYWIYYKALIKQNLKLNRKEDIYRASYITKFNIFRRIYLSIVLLIMFSILFISSDEARNAFVSLLGLIIIFNGSLIVYSHSVYKSVEFTAFMRVEKYKMENLNKEETI